MAVWRRSFLRLGRGVAWEEPFLNSFFNSVVVS